MSLKILIFKHKQLLTKSYTIERKYDLADGSRNLKKMCPASHPPHPEYTTTDRTPVRPGGSLRESSAVYADAPPPKV